MALLNVGAEDEKSRLDHACNWLSRECPELSSQRLLSRSQKLVGALVVLVVLIGVVISPLDTAIALVGIATASYVVILACRVLLIVRSLRHPNLVVVSDEEARALTDHQLPPYTVLVPMFREAAMVPELLAHLSALDYPRDRLDVKLILEEQDLATLSAVMAQGTEDFDVVVVPAGGPQTKPKALNYGLTFARGDIVTIYDAEDRPDPLQLRKAVVAFGRLPDRVGCLQAKLDYWNSEQNLITRWFGAEYLQWFRLLLPGLAASDAPLPLGGTSNHIRRELLEAVGGWDPYNVTEDADLGIRLHRAGYRSAVLDSVTFEEANSDYVNWNRQRSRWYKGYLQTWLVHSRHPLRLLEQLGWTGWLEFSSSVGATPVLSLVNLVFWALTIAWFVGHVGIVRSLFPTPIYFPALACFVLGNVTFAYMYIISARLANRPSLVWAACLVPVYWLMMGIAAVKAFWQLGVERSFWEKTVHGLVRRDDHVFDPQALSVAPTAAAAAFAPMGPPLLASRINEPKRSGAPRGLSVHWSLALAKWLQALGLVLLLVTLYVVVIAGHGSGPAVKEGSVSEPIGPHPAQGLTVASVEIPSVHIDDQVVEGSTSAVVGANLGHVPGTALPGEHGDAVIVGHRVTEGGSLGRLVDVRVGDHVVTWIGGGFARYRVVSISSQEGQSIVLAPPWMSQLTIVTGSGLDPNRFLVVRAELVSKSGIRFQGPVRPTARQAELPGFDGHWMFVTLLWFAVTLGAMRLGRFVRRRWGMSWGLGLVGPALFVAMYAMCISASRTLPITL